MSGFREKEGLQAAGSYSKTIVFIENYWACVVLKLLGVIPDKPAS